MGEGWIQMCPEPGPLVLPKILTEEKLLQIRSCQQKAVASNRALPVVRELRPGKTTENVVNYHHPK